MDTQHIEKVCTTCNITVAVRVDMTQAFALSCPQCRQTIYLHNPQAKVTVPEQKKAKRTKAPVMVETGEVERGLWKPGEREAARRLLDW